jgi:hypothetical protein
VKFLSKPSLTVLDAPTWFDARNWAASNLGESDVELAGDHAVADVEIRWVGVDLNGDTRRMQLRKRGGRWR